MPKGSSDLVVAQIGDELKRKLYSKLALEGKTFKEWLIETVKVFTQEPPIKKP